MTVTYIQPSLNLAELLPFLLEAEPAQVYPRGTELFPQETEPQCVFAISKGLIKLAYTSADDRHAVIGVRGRGWILGAGAALRERPYEVTATAITRCQAYRISVERFRSELRTDEALSRYVYTMLASEVGRFVAYSIALSCESARSRLEHFLEEVALELDGSDGNDELPLRDWEIAQLISVTPQYLSRLLHELIEEGRLRRGKGRQLVLNGQSVPWSGSPPSK